jgi:hypothetical protein
MANNTAGGSDTVILATILFILVGVGFFMPYIESWAGISSSGYKYIDVPANVTVSTPLDVTGAVTAWDIMASITRSLFWVYPWESPVGNILIQIIFYLHLFIRMIAGYLVVRLARGI